MTTEQPVGATEAPELTPTDAPTVGTEAGAADPKPKPTVDTAVAGAPDGDLVSPTGVVDAASKEAPFDGQKAGSVAQMAANIEAAMKEMPTAVAEKPAGHSQVSIGSR